MAVILFIVSASTLVFNGLVVAKIIRKRSHKLFTRYFLLSLAFSDILVGFFVMPFSLSGFFYHTNQLLGSKTCEIINSFDVLSTSASILHLSVLTFERYIAICRTFDYIKYCNTKTMMLSSLFCWSIVIVFSFGLILPGYSAQDMDKLKTECVFAPNISYNIVAGVLFFVIPVTLVVVCNICVWNYVTRRRTMRKQFSSDHRQRFQLRGIRVTKTIATLTGCFLICWAPFMVIILLNISSYIDVTNDLMFVFTWLGYINSTVNPILYLLLEGKTCIGRG